MEKLRIKTQIPYSYFGEGMLIGSITAICLRLRNFAESAKDEGWENIVLEETDDGYGENHEIIATGYRLETDEEANHRRLEMAKLEINKKRLEIEERKLYEVLKLKFEPNEIQNKKSTN